MVSKVALLMLAEKVVKNASISGDRLTITFSDDSTKDLTITGGSGGGGDPVEVQGQRGTMVGSSSMADSTQEDLPLQSSEPYGPPTALQVSVDVKEVGSYICVAVLNAVGAHESKGGETVTTTYFGKSWTYNTRGSAAIGRFDMDTVVSGKVPFTSDMFITGGTTVVFSVNRTFIDVPIGLHTFKLGLYQQAANDHCAYRCAAMMVFRL